jgi:hypothetical protein
MYKVCTTRSRTSYKIVPTTDLNIYVYFYNGKSEIKVNITKTKLNSMALVRELTIPTERPPPVGEVSANFCG